MSPHKSFEINGPRPSPLLIHKHSRLIRKAAPPPSQQPQLRQPIIIYTHSPKIIHTQPKDFMSLVQRLTGCTPSSDAVPEAKDTVNKPLSSESSDRNLNDNDCSSALTDDDDNINHCGDRRESNSCSFLSDFPLFTPRSSSSPVLRYSSSDTTPFSSPGMVNSLSPSFMEFLKALPEF